VFRGCFSDRSWRDVQAALHGGAFDKPGQCAGDLVGFTNFPEVARALARFVERPAVQRGLNIPAAPV
jgi:hypothetical protein